MDNSEIKVANVNNEASTSEDMNFSRSHRQILKKDHTCPICFLTIKTEQLEDHLQLEVDRLKFKKTGVQKPPSMATHDLQEYDRIKLRREFRSQAAKLKAGIPDLPACPLCHLEHNSSYDTFKDHFELCLAGVSPQHESVEESVELIGDEYEWCGQKKIRLTSLMKAAGNLEALGTIVMKGDEMHDVEICDTNEEDATDPQYTEKDVEFAKDDIDTDVQTKTNNDHICSICLNSYDKPVVSISCWHVYCEKCWLQILGSSKLCPVDKCITLPGMLRKIYL